MSDKAEQRRSLRGIALFSALTDRALADIAERCTWRSFRPGQQVVHHLDQGTELFCIVEGQLRAVIYSAAGKEVSYRDLEAGEIFGEFAAIDDQPRSATVVALSACLVAELTAKDFRELIRANPHVAEELLKHLTRLIRLYSERIREFAVFPAGIRVRMELVRLARRRRARDNLAIIDPAPSHQEIANRIGSHREAVTRELNALRREGLLRVGRRSLTILDLARLEGLVHRSIGESVIDADL